MPVQLHKNLTINAPAQRVFDFWADFRNFQKFIPVIDSIEILNDKQSLWVILAPLGHKVTFESLITTFEPGSRLIWESRYADCYATGDLRLTEQGETTCVDLVYKYYLHSNCIQNMARLVSRFGFPSLAFDYGLARIKEKIEKDRLGKGV